jgi:hypothetical protein
MCEQEKTVALLDRPAAVISGRKSIYTLYTVAAGLGLDCNSLFLPSSSSSSSSSSSIAQKKEDAILCLLFTYFLISVFSIFVPYYLNK